MAITFIHTLPDMDASTGLLTLDADVAANDTIILTRLYQVNVPSPPVWNGGGPPGAGTWQLDATLAITGGMGGGFGSGGGITYLDICSCQPTALVPAGTEIAALGAGGGSFGAYVDTANGGVFRGILLSTFRMLPVVGGTSLYEASRTGTTVPATLETLGPISLVAAPTGDILIVCFGAADNTDYWPWDDGSFGFYPVTPPIAPGVSLNTVAGIPSLTSLSVLTDNRPDGSGTFTGFPGSALRNATGQVSYCICTDYTAKTLEADFPDLIGGQGNPTADPLIYGGQVPEQSCWGLAFIIYGSFPGLSDGPWNLQTRAGQYHVSYAMAANIEYNRSFQTLPPFDGPFELAGGGGDAQFRMAELSYPANRVAGIWNRSGVILAANTDDDGATWSSPVTLWGAGKNPTVAHDARTGTTVYACFVTDHLEARVQGPGATSPGTAFTLTDGSSALTVDDATFHIQPASDTPGRWLLVLLDGGAVKNYESWDEGATWTAI